VGDGMARYAARERKLEEFTWDQWVGLAAYDLYHNSGY